MPDQDPGPDPTTQYPGPEAQGPEQLDHPGRSADMDLHPDHGEESYRGSGKLTGKRALITGGDSGIGRAVAIAFAREGADVLISYLDEEETTPRRPAGWSRRRVAARSPYRATSGEENHCQKLVNQRCRELGGLDILVNNAAYQMAQEGHREHHHRAVRPGDEDQRVRDVLAVQGRDAAHGAGSGDHQHLLDPGLPAVAELLDYATTKAAILNFTKALAQELAEKGIRVNAVAPGPIWTPLIPATMPPDKVDQFGADTPLGRAGQPAELAPAYVFLASQDSSYVTGERIGVTGGKPLP